MRIYAPSVRMFSYVDNLNVQATQATVVVMAFFALQTYMSLWGLLLDKTFVWATTSAARTSIAFGVECKKTTSELGGSLSFQAGRHSKILRSRGNKMDAKWDRLQRSRQPLSVKLQGLPSAMWSEALHGACGSLVSSHYIHDLRKKAIKSLGLRKGGANGWIRLALSDPPQADPGYFQLIRTFFDCRRLANKIPDVVQQWKVFHARFDGRLFDGPFSKMADLFGMLGWSMQTPPMVWSHEAFEFDFLDIHNSALVSLARDGWLRYVAGQVNARKSLPGLHSFDIHLCTLEDHRLDCRQLAQIRAIQEGAFLAPGQQAHFDASKQALCHLCGVPDAQTHWLKEGHQADLCQADIADQPDYVLQHLLMPVSPDLPALHRVLEAIPRTFDYMTAPVGPVQHLFTDGSRIEHQGPSTALASWSVINATSGLVVSHRRLAERN